MTTGPHPQSCIIIGRSPFVNEVDINNLTSNYTTIGINNVCHRYTVDYSVFYDAYIPGHLPTTVIAPLWIDTPESVPSLKITPKPSERPIVPAQYQGGNLCLGMMLYSVSLAVNFAILQNFKRIYLVGIDHDEIDGAFPHYDSEPEVVVPLLAESHARLKQYVYNARQWADIYQCNPKADWQLPYKDVENLYVTQK